jgi:hypothetical protein
MHQTNSSKSLGVEGSWFRWSRYDIDNGVLVPAEGAELQQYDPWVDFRSNAGKYRTVDQPYVPILELHRKLTILGGKHNVWPTPARAAKRGMQNEADELIVAWCNQHGFLGLVPVLSNSIRPAPVKRLATAEFLLPRIRTDPTISEQEVGGHRGFL